MWQQFENNFAKSTDIYIVADEEGSQFALKLHRLVQLYSIQTNVSELECVFYSNF